LAEAKVAMREFLPTRRRCAPRGKEDSGVLYYDDIDPSTLDTGNVTIRQTACLVSGSIAANRGSES